MKGINMLFSLRDARVLACIREGKEYRGEGDHFQKGRHNPKPAI